MDKPIADAIMSWVKANPMFVVKVLDGHHASDIRITLKCRRGKEMRWSATSRWFNLNELQDENVDVYLNGMKAKLLGLDELEINRTV